MHLFQPFFSYNPPDEDASQDIKVLEIGKRDNVTFMKFLKKISSDDKEVLLIAVLKGNHFHSLFSSTLSYFISIF